MFHEKKTDKNARISSKKTYMMSKTTLISFFIDFS